MEWGNVVTDDRIDAPASLNLEKALVLAATAATMWCARGADKSTGQRLVEHLMLAATWASRARREAGMGPISLAELVSGFEQPVERWLTGHHPFALVEHGQPTLECQELAEDAGSSPLAEVEQKVIKVAMAHLAGREDGADAYATLRRFLVENATARRSIAAEALQRASLSLAELYQRIPESAVVSQGTERVFYPCPRCRWPMNVQGKMVACRSASCTAAGARFDRSEGHLVGLGKLTPCEPIPEAGMASLRPGIWRFTVLPGLEEIDLAARLAPISGVVVQLWPFVDAYDLDVRRGEHHWRIDVKDYRLAMTLARHLSSRPSREPTWIVVPDARSDQVRVLVQHVAGDAGYQFASASEMVRRVKGAV